MRLTGSLRVDIHLLYPLLATTEVSQAIFEFTTTTVKAKSDHLFFLYFSMDKNRYFYLYRTFLNKF